MSRLIAVAVTSILVLGIGFFLYFKYFNSNYSANSDDWANFATFNGYFVNIVSLLILGYLSYLTFVATEHYNKMQLRPILFLVTDIPWQIENPPFKDTWVVINGAKNPALNILVRYTESRESNVFSRWVSCGSLAENGKLELFWVHWADKIEICFTDLSQEKYYLYEFLDFNGKTKQINRDDYLRIFQDATDNRNNNITHLRDKLEKYIFEQRKALNTDPMKDYSNSFIKPLIFSPPNNTL